MEILNQQTINPDLHCVYHIRRPLHRGKLNEGYIGISIDPVERLKQHLRTPNKTLKKMLVKHPDIECEVISQGTEEEVLNMEKSLRPCRNVGWNIAEGGGKPPAGAHEGFLHSDSTKARISKAKKGKCGGANHPNFGKSASDETRKKQSFAKLGRRFTRKIIMCPHCNKTGGSNMMYRYHFNNCTHFMIDGMFFDNITRAIEVTGFSEKTIRTYCSSKSKSEWYTIPRTVEVAGSNENEE